MRSLLLVLWAILVTGASLSGVAGAQGDDQLPAVQVSIERPGEGETFYAGPASLLYSITVTGWASSSEYESSQVDVRLDVIQAGENVDQLSTRPRADGSFFFSVTANPKGLPLNTPDPTCLHCHYTSELTLPPGPVLFRVTVRDPLGHTATSERHIIVDLSGHATIPVEIQGTGEDDVIPPDLPVSAAGWLYSWRARYGVGTTNVRGQATVRVEALAEMLTKYTLTVPPTVREGLVYEGIEPVDVVIPAGATRGSLVTLRVHSHGGKIAGVVQPIPTDAVRLQAIRIPQGTTFFTTTRADGSFRFPDLPVAPYLLTADPTSMAERGLTADCTEIDLTRTTGATTTLSLASAQPHQVNIVVRDESDNPVPFGWVIVDELRRVRRTSPLSGEARLFDLPPGPLSLTIAAPGFYSQARAVEMTTDTLTAQLVENPATKKVAWGGGELVIPPETIYAEGNEQISLIRGWLWGTGKNDHAPPLIVGTVSLHQADGSFALETIPEKGSWLYVLDGTSTVRREGEAPISVRAGEMMALLPDSQLRPVPLAMETVELLQTDAGAAAPSPVWQPTFSAQIRDRLARLGVTMAQLITFITYIIVLLSLLAIPVAGVYLWRKRQEHRPRGSPH